MNDDNVIGLSFMYWNCLFCGHKTQAKSYSLRRGEKVTSFALHRRHVEHNCEAARAWREREFPS